MLEAVRIRIEVGQVSDAATRYKKQKILNYVPDKERAPIVVNQPVFLRDTF